MYLKQNKSQTLPAQTLRIEIPLPRENSTFNGGVYMLGLYDWRNPAGLKDKVLMSFFKKLKTDGINTIYLTINDYLDTIEIKDGIKKTQQLVLYETRLKKYISVASQNGIKVHALAGDFNWSESPNDYLPSLAIGTVFAYNKKVTAPERFTGIQFDIEPYNLPGFADNQKTIFNNYLTKIEQIITQVRVNTDNPEFSLGFALPYWLDGENGNIEKITWKGKTDFSFYHVADLLNSYDNTYISLMSYRNIPSGENGTLAISQNEIKYTANTAAKVTMIIAQETTNVEPAKITFYGKSAFEFYTAVNILYNTLKVNKSFGGVSIHDSTGYFLLK